jgi:predicted patatin/cPLA2 family phospholipase
MLHPVKELMQKRLLGQSDPSSLSLVIEGGAMRGAVTAGMVEALEELGYSAVFDDIWATSVGAITGAYFITGDAALGASTYIDDLRDERFFNIKRLLKGSPPLSLEYAYDHLTNYIKPLDIDALLQAKTKLHPLASCLETATLDDLGDFNDGESLRLRFKASSCLPFLAGDPIKVKEKHYFDGGLLDSLPFRKARENGATHILVLQSWPKNHPRKPPSLLERSIAKKVLSSYRKEFLRSYLARASLYNRDSQFLLQSSSAVSDAAPHILSVAPDESALIHHLTKKRSDVLRARNSGIVSIAQTFKK